MCLLQDFGKEQILLLTQDFCVCGLHSITEPHSTGLLLSPTLSSFSRTSPVPACCEEDLCASHPAACLGAGFTLSQNPLRKISANPCLKRRLLWELKHVFKIRLHTRCNMPSNIFLLLP